MADERAQGDWVKWPGGLIIGVVVGIIVAIVAWVAIGWAIGLTVLVVVLVVGAGAIAARMANPASADADTDPTSTRPGQPPHPERPLGDTREAHDEITPHDIPPGTSTRREAERRAEAESGDPEGTFRGGDDER